MKTSDLLKNLDTWSKKVNDIAVNLSSDRGQFYEISDQIGFLSEYLKAANLSLTSRPTVDMLESFLIEDPYPVLDHGFVKLKDYMGEDLSVVQSARVSQGAGTKSFREDRGLINYMMKMRHTSPYEMVEVKCHMKMPIFVARQIVRHRTANCNEVSARFSILANEFYIPEPGVLGIQSKVNKQGRESLADDMIEYQNGIRKEIMDHCDLSSILYHGLLNSDDEGNFLIGEEPGLTRELSRMVLPLNVYTEWYWKIDMHNLLHFLELRLDEHAQWETRQYAYALARIVRVGYPIIWEAFDNYRLRSITLSGDQVKVLNNFMSGRSFEEASEGLPRRDRQELLDKFPIKELEVV